MTNFTMPNKKCSMKYALKSVPDLADVGVPHGDEDGPFKGCCDLDYKGNVTNLQQWLIRYLYANFEQNWSINTRDISESHCGLCLAFVLTMLNF